MRLGQFLIFAIFAGVFANSFDASAAQLEWSVINPFRFYKNQEDFQRHLDAYQRVVKENSGIRPEDAIRRMERDLNAPGCSKPETPATCDASQNEDYTTRRHGWATHSFDAVCYEYNRDAGYYQHKIKCTRTYKWDLGEQEKHFVVENYIRPSSHAVKLQIGLPERDIFKGHPCKWFWKAHESNSNEQEGSENDCSAPVVIREVPWPDGLHVHVELPDKTTIDDDVIVEDLLVVGLGDSFASGEGNPDQPIDPHPSFSMSYGAGLTYPLPVRNTGEPARFDAAANADRTLFYKAAAKWLSADCHKSQYSYQFRVALQLAIENPKRAVTFVHLACSGAEITEGLFNKKEAREHYDESSVVPSQLDQLFILLCKVKRQPIAIHLRTPVHYGFPEMEDRTFEVNACTPDEFQRKIDLAMISFGGNDIGFPALVGYTIIDHTRDVVPAIPLYEAITKTKVIFSPDISKKYLDALDQRFSVVKNFFEKDLALPPNRVIQTSYEAMHRDADGNLCKGTTGLDVHPGFEFIDQRLKDVDNFVCSFLVRLACITDVKSDYACPSQPATSCPKTLATGDGTHFRFVTSHQPAFDRRGICAIEPNTQEAKFSREPKLDPASDAPDQFTPWDPATFHPYAARRRLFVSPNDAFLTANTHKDGLGSPALDDAVQLLFASLYSGAFHPTAEAHAIIADNVYAEALELLKRSH